ncbi:MAG: hypothetical protein HYS05_08220, partial [Acidobacteria bacterium]|nr:hypothetical protein [Acidobacteriota bacterium]
MKRTTEVAEVSPKTGAVSRTNPMGVPLWAVGLLPLVLLAALIAAIVW